MSTLIKSCYSGLLGKLRSSGGWGPQELLGWSASELAAPSWEGRRRKAVLLHPFFLFVLCLAESA